LILTILTLLARCSSKIADNFSAKVPLFTTPEEVDFSILLSNVVFISFQLIPFGKKGKLSKS